MKQVDIIKNKMNPSSRKMAKSLIKLGFGLETIIRW